jgi:hypothetical protein
LLVDGGLLSDSLGGSVVVLPNASGDAGQSIANRQVRDSAGTSVVASPEMPVSTADRVGGPTLADLHDEQLDELLNSIVDEPGDLVGSEEALDAFFSRLGA